MSFVTVYVVMSEDSTKCLNVAPSLGATEAYQHLALGWLKGHIVAAKVSETMAAELWQLVVVKGQHEAGAKLLKTFAHSIQRCGDATGG